MNKHALLVGINNYKGVSDLRGCINDVNNIHDVLVGLFGFSNDRVKILTDEMATKKNIISALESMVKAARRDDQLIFHFSGHGSQIRDTDNDELKDHLDELICPYDMNWDKGFITDDMMGNILNKLDPGVEMEIILDCCHSGTGTRDIIEAHQTGDDGKELRSMIRYLEPPSEIRERFSSREAGTFKIKAFRTDRDISLNHVLWTGCLDYQTSEDAFFDGSYYGAFSYFFCKHITENSGLISRQDLHHRVQESIVLHNYDQTPQLECSPERKIMNVFGGIINK